MSLSRALAAVVAAIALALAVLAWRSQDPAPAVQLAAPAVKLGSTPKRIATFSAPSPRLPAASLPVPVLPVENPTVVAVDKGVH